MVVIIDGGPLRRRLRETLALSKILKNTCQPRDISFIRQDAGGDDQDPAIRSGGSPAADFVWCTLAQAPFGLGRLASAHHGHR